MPAKDRYVRLDLHFDTPGSRIDMVRSALGERGYDLLEYSLDWRPGGVVYSLQLRCTRPADRERLTQELAAMTEPDAPRRITWK